MAAVLSVREMIDSALGSYDENTVNFKMLQSVLYVLAQHLRMLERRVDLHDLREHSNTSITLTEVKLQANVKVERGSDTEMEGSKREPSHGRISVVTQSQFAELEALVHDLQKRQQKSSTHISTLIPSNDEAIAHIRHGSLSLPDAMVTLKVVARIEAIEQAIERIMGLIEELAVTSKHPPSPVDEETRSTSKVSIQMEPTIITSERKQSLASIKTHVQKDSMRSTKSQPPMLDQALVTEEELRKATAELQIEIQKNANLTEQQITTCVDTTMKKISLFEEKLTELTQVQERMSALESLIHDYSDQMNSLDAGLSSQITSFTEQLNELQADLEEGLQQAIESAAVGGDTAALSELNVKVKNLIADSEATSTSIQSLDSDTRSIMDNLQDLYLQIEVLKEVKVDRDEMSDALRDKADMSALNQIVPVTYFEAVRESIVGRQEAAAEKFIRCETAWQNAIDDLRTELDEKADKLQLEPLREYLDGRLIEVLRRIQELTRAVGEPRAAGVTRRMLRGSDCIACSAPAVLKEERSRLPRMPYAIAKGVRPPVVGAEKSETDEFVCRTKWPTGTHLCHRYCGGSHTVLNSGMVARTQFPDIQVSPVTRRVVPMKGTDGRLYQMEEMVTDKPCSPCNQPPTKSHGNVQVQTSPGGSICACSMDVPGCACSMDVPVCACSMDVPVCACSMEMSRRSSQVFDTELSLPPLPGI